MTTGITVTLEELMRLHGEARLLDLAPRALRTPPRSGLHLSSFRGRGMEFAEVRPYAPGDDVRHIDWRVTARSGHTATKLFREERERPVSLIIDQTATMRFGTRVAFKSVIAARAAALLAWAAVDQGDRVGGMILRDDGITELRPRRGHTTLLPLMRILAQPAVTTTLPPSMPAWIDALQRAVRLNRPGSLWIVVSDFYQPHQQAEGWLNELRRHSDVMLVFVYDVLERNPPPPGRYGFSDGMHYATLDLNGETTRWAYQQPLLARLRFLEDLARRLRLPLLQLATDDAPANQLSRSIARIKNAHHAALT